MSQVTVSEEFWHRIDAVIREAQEIAAEYPTIAGRAYRIQQEEIGESPKTWRRIERSVYKMSKAVARLQHPPSNA